MIFSSTSSTPLSKEQAVWLSEYYEQCHEAYKPVFHRLPTRASLSPNILERIFRPNLEYEVLHHYWHAEDEEPLVQETYRIKSWAVSALVDACLQVRDVVADYCGTSQHKDSYGPFSLLYQKFIYAGIKYPREPTYIFDEMYFQDEYDTLDRLVNHVHSAQLWGIFMITALHCLALYDGLPPCELRSQLPDLPMSQLVLARNASFAKQLKVHSDWDEYHLAGHGYVPEAPGSHSPCNSSPLNLPAPPCSPAGPTPSPTLSGLLDFSPARAALPANAPLL
ncbi:hypothetical protein CTheo_8860 [Ceratobasidium theobromae]|uniref:Uncharacterized protein n=1 Tax=Ceratobasidium theobromae TaxID=1582974 RepID=A0A5N5Q8G5_9AGAM|nr:hypothetical protein CTheo_8860 [Ceratobasidium theobromae]